MNSTSKQIVQSSLSSAVSSNQISAKTAQLLLEPLDAIAVAGSSIGMDDIDSDEVTIATLILDASGSMLGEQDTVIEAYRENILKPLRGAKNADSILVSLILFSGSSSRLVHGFMPVKQVPELDKSIYNPDGNTPLNMAVHQGLAGLTSYGQALHASGTRSKRICCVITDGGENSSPSQFTNISLKQIAADLLSRENYVLSYCLMGPDSYAEQAAAEIGFPKQHMLPRDKQASGKSETDLRRIFGLFSASIISASQTSIATNLSQNPFIVPNP